MCVCVCSKFCLFVSVSVCSQKYTTHGPNRSDFMFTRSHLFEDSFAAIRKLQGEEINKLKGRLWIVFIGETGIDYGGVSRSVGPWCSLMKYLHGLHTLPTFSLLIF